MTKVFESQKRRFRIKGYYCSPVQPIRTRKRDYRRDKTNSIRCMRDKNVWFLRARPTNTLFHIEIERVETFNMPFSCVTLWINIHLPLVQTADSPLSVLYPFYCATFYWSSRIKRAKYGLPAYVRLNQRKIVNLFWRRGGGGGRRFSVANNSKQCTTYTLPISNWIISRYW